MRLRLRNGKYVKCSHVATSRVNVNIGAVCARASKELAAIVVNVNKSGFLPIPYAVCLSFVTLVRRIKPVEILLNFCATVCKRFAFAIGPSSCPVCPIYLSVMYVHCGQTVGRIKMKLGMQVGLDPDHILLDRDSTPRAWKGVKPPPIFGPYLLQRNGWMDQDANCYGGRSHPRRLCVRLGPSSPNQKRGRSPQFLAHFYCGQQ